MRKQNLQAALHLPVHQDARAAFWQDALIR
jgi:hypothetical protein